MSSLWTELAGWWLRLALAGALLLLAGVVLVLACRRPAIRLRTASLVFAVAVLLVPLSFSPAWVQLPLIISAPAEPASAPVVQPAPNIPAPSAGHITFSDSNWEPMLIAPAEPQPRIDRPLHEPRVGTASALVAPVGTSLIASAEKRSHLGWIANILLVGYLAIVLIQLARLVVGQGRLEWLWRTGTGPKLDVQQAFYRLACRFGCRPALRESDRVAGPICFGLWRRRVLIPTALANVADERSLNWIIAHELSHLRRRDPLVNWLTGIVQALYFFVPWFWKLRREVRLNQEFLADAAAVEVSGSASQSVSDASAADYADFLVRLTCTGKIPVVATAVKSPSSDLYRRVTMLLRKSGTVETKCPRRWSMLVGGVLLSLGIVLGGLQFSTRNVAAQSDAVKEVATADDEDAIRKAIESLKKGPEPKKEEKPAVDLNPIDQAKQAEEALKKAQEELRKNPASDDARKAFDEAVKKFQDSVRSRQPQALPPLAVPVFPQFPEFPQVQPINPIDFDKEVERMNEQLLKAIEELQRQMQVQPGLFPANRRMPFGGFRDMARRNSEGRLGVRVERPSSILMEQLDLPANKGVVVTEVVPNSAGEKAGIKVNDILLELGGESISSEVLELQRMLLEIKADDKVDVVLLRKGKKETIKGISLPEIRVDQFNPFNPRLIPLLPNNPRFPNGFPPEFFGNGANTAMSIQMVNGEYTIKYQEDTVKVTVWGAKENGQFKPSSIEIDDNGKTIKAESLEKVDEAYRPVVEKVLKRIP